MFTHIYFQLSQLPPTPTALPTVAPEDVAMGLQFEGFSLWDVAPHSIQWWNSASVVTTFAQAIILLLLVLACSMAVIRQWKNAEEKLTWES